MDVKTLPDNPYILLTPGPLSTSKTVKATMLRDWCTWDDDYNMIVQEIRQKLVRLATEQDGYTSVLMQGSGTFSVEATIGTAVPPEGKLLVLTNGAYGDRMALIAKRLKIPLVVNDSGESLPPDLDSLNKTLEEDPAITHVAVVHCETTTGMLNPIDLIGGIAKSHGKIYIVDAMSSFGGIPMDAAKLNIDFLVSSANKCIQGVPGFGFVVAKISEMEKCVGWARSLSLDMHDQWRVMEEKNGKWRFTSPTHTVRGFAQALNELEQEGGIEKRYVRYRENHRILVDGMREIGFETFLTDQYQAPIITSFVNPDHPYYVFKEFYLRLKAKGFVIYPGKVTGADTFRIGNIGDIRPDDMKRLVKAVDQSIYWPRTSNRAEASSL
jgi:2-aminoethylphosphonate-pyruvate transaminase